MTQPQDSMAVPQKIKTLRFWLVTAFALLGLVATLLLGRWQLSRAAQKENLQAQVEVQASQAPLDAAAFLALLEPTQEVHRRVLLRGRWLGDKTVYLDNRQMNGRPGFFVITPLKIEGAASVVLVQRGWVPRNFENRAQLPAVATTSEVVEISGRIAQAPSKLFEPGQWSQGNDAPASERGAVWSPLRQNLDLPKFRLETQLPLLDVSLLQTGSASDGLRRDWPDVATTASKNYGYAFQWFGLAGLIFILYVWFQVVKPLVASHARPE